MSGPHILSDAFRAATDVSAQVLAERLRQIEKKGYDAAHDDTHVDGDLERAAACYAAHAAGAHRMTALEYRTAAPPADWPWGAADWKPKDPRRDLIRAAALAEAAIERRDRRAAGVALSAP